MLQVSRDMQQSDRAASLQAYLRGQPKDWIALFTLAKVEQMSGRYGHAEALLRKALEVKGEQVEIAVNLANSLWMQDRRQEAATFYKKTVDRWPGNFLAHYNLGRIYLHEADFDEGNRLLQKAKTLDLSQWNQMEEEWQQLNSNELLLRDANLAVDTIGRQSANAAQVDLPLAWIATITSLFLLVLILGALALLRERGSTAYRCERCGRLTCESCDHDSAFSGNCSQCYNIYVKKVTLDPELRLRKDYRVQKYQNRRKKAALFFNLLVPGIGSVYRNKQLLGVLQLTLTAMFAVYWLPLPYFPRVTQSAFLPGFVGVGVILLFIVHYIASLTSALRN
jgi:tetratricopeptide (TPR) repeat protein